MSFNLTQYCVKDGLAFDGIKFVIHKYVNYLIHKYYYLVALKALSDKC